MAQHARDKITRSHQTSMGSRRQIPFIEFTLLVVLLFQPFFLTDYLTTYATRMLILCILALSFDLIWGYGGILSFGQAAFFGVAGYVAAVMARDLGVTSVFLVVPVAIFVGASLAAIVGSFLLIGKNPATLIFVGLGTLVFSYSLERLAIGWYYVGAQNGIPGFPGLTIAGYDVIAGNMFYYLVLVILLLSYLVCRIIVRSQFGLALAGLRQNERRLAFFGYNVQYLKTFIFVLGGAFAGLSGSLYAFHEHFVWPGMLGIVMSTQAVVYVLFGGAGTLIGAILGVHVVEVVSYWLADVAQGTWSMILGVILLLLILFRPAGLVSLVVPRRELIGFTGGDKEADREHS